MPACFSAELHTLNLALRLVASYLIVFSLAAAQALAQPAGQRIDGPAAPDLPDVISRSADGLATVRALRVPAPLVFDGRLDEAFYRDVKSFGDFIQQDPFEGQPATDKTEVWVFFDATNIYVSARLWETHRDRRVAKIGRAHV